MQPNRDALLQSSELCRRMSVGASADAQAVLQDMANNFQRRAEVEPLDRVSSRRVTFWGCMALVTVAWRSLLAQNVRPNCNFSEGSRSNREFAETLLQHRRLRCHGARLLVWKRCRLSHRSLSFADTNL